MIAEKKGVASTDICHVWEKHVPHVLSDAVNSARSDPALSDILESFGFQDLTFSDENSIVLADLSQGTLFK